MLVQAEVDSLFPPDLPEPEHWESTYPARKLAEGAKVTRFFSALPALCTSAASTLQ